ncbi:MAG: hypothetical protein MJZ57_08515 [Bacteroidales bacterium]|nr:hypothetical protein [Bacteroidales bacterium]
MNVYAIIDSFAYRVDMRRRRRRADGRVDRFPLAKLTSEEKQQARQRWDGCSLKGFQFYKAYCGKIDPNCVPADYYDFVEHVLNLRWSSFFLQHKCNLKYFIPAEHRPKTILQKIDGHWVTEDNVEVNQDEAVAMLKKHEVMVGKIAMGTGGGKGVQKFYAEDITFDNKNFRDLMQQHDVVFQKVLRQNDFLNQFNADSVNTFRIVTLNLNGKCSVLTAVFRMGAKGSFVDNLTSGGGMLVGIKQDGSFHDFGIRKSYEKVYESPTGLVFKGMKVPNWEEIKQTVMAFHQHIPYANLISWDITLDQDGNIVVVEVNLDSGELEIYQLYNGPIFGDRLDEVRAYVESRKPSLRHAMITY